MEQKDLKGKLFFIYYEYHKSYTGSVGLANNFN